MRKRTIMTYVTLSPENQIVVPPEAREALQLKPGDELLIVVRGPRFIALRKPESPHAAIRGMGRQVYPSGYLQKERRSWE
jgi:AbrB family looped-hinge helix DNA binding protein